MRSCSLPTCVRLTGSPDRRLAFLRDVARRWAVELAPTAPRTLPPRAIAARALARAQTFPYAPDDAGTVDLVTVDRATFEREGGDCEERAVWLAAALAAARIPAELVWLSQPGQEADHVTVRAHLDGRWLWADPTVPGARLGEHPQDAADRVGDAAIARRLG